MCDAYVDEHKPNTMGFNDTSVLLHRWSMRGLILCFLTGCAGTVPVLTEHVYSTVGVVESVADTTNRLGSLSQITTLRLVRDPLRGRMCMVPDSIAPVNAPVQVLVVVDDMHEIRCKLVSKP